MNQDYDGLLELSDGGILWTRKFDVMACEGYLADTLSEAKLKLAAMGLEIEEEQPEMWRLAPGFTRRHWKVRPSSPVPRNGPAPKDPRTPAGCA